MGAETDAATREIVRFVMSTGPRDLTAGHRAAAVRVHLDAMGCAFGGFMAAPCQIARAVASTAFVPTGCSVLGLPSLVAAEQATFANVAMVRQLDYNDSYEGRVHPSEVLPGLIAAAELTGATGADLGYATAIAYEVLAGVADSYDLRSAGFDNGVLIALGTAVGAAVLFGTDATSLANAVALAVTPSMPMRSTRAGELSHWKGCAMAHSSMTGLFAARLAMAGLSGPPSPFVGVDGLDRHVPPRSPVMIGRARNGLGAIERTCFKYYPAEFHSQALVSAFADRLAELPVARIASIEIDTYHLGWSEIGGGLSDRGPKWDPKTRETADHSLPYLLAVTLVDGTVDESSFALQRVTDPALRPVMNLISVRERPDLTERAANDGERTSHVRVRFDDGTTNDFTATYHRGHYRNPMSEQQLSAKFNAQVPPVVGSAAAARIESTIADLWSLPSVRNLTKHLRFDGGRTMVDGS